MTHSQLNFRRIVPSCRPCWYAYFQLWAPADDDKGGFEIINPVDRVTAKNGNGNRKVLSKSGGVTRSCVTFLIAYIIFFKYLKIIRNVVFSLRIRRTDKHPHLPPFQEGRRGM
jgi:hypothetical protein